MLLCDMKFAHFDDVTVTVACGRERNLRSALYVHGYRGHPAEFCVSGTCVIYPCMYIQYINTYIVSLSLHNAVEVDITANCRLTLTSSIILNSIHVRIDIVVRGTRRHQNPREESYVGSRCAECLVDSLRGVETRRGVRIA